MAAVLLLLGTLAMLLDGVWAQAVIRAGGVALIFIPVYTLFLAIPLWIAAWVARGLKDLAEEQRAPLSADTPHGAGTRRSSSDRSRMLGRISLLCSSASVIVALITASAIVRGLAVAALVVAAAGLLDPRRSQAGKRLAVGGLAAGCMGLYAARLAGQSL